MAFQSRMTDGDFRDLDFLIAGCTPLVECKPLAFS